MITLEDIECLLDCRMENGKKLRECTERDIRFVAAILKLNVAEEIREREERDAMRIAQEATKTLGLEAVA